MKWSSKLLCVVVFLSSLLLVFGMGRMNVRQFSIVQQSIEGIYKDRLVVNGMIFELANLLHKKEIAIVSSDKDFFERTNTSINIQINEIINDFKQTYLTKLEEKTLIRFESGIGKLKTTEIKIIFEDNGDLNFIIKKQLLSLLDSLKIDLNTLSGIQLSEGKRKLISSDRAVEVMDTNQTIENYSILVIAFLILLVVLLPVPKPDKMIKSN